MGNPMLDLLSRGASPTPAQPAAPSSPDLTQVRSLYQAYRMARNPAAMLSQMAAENPMLSQLRQIQSGGGNMQQAFYALCRQRGIDPQTILTQLQS